MPGRYESTPLEQRIFRITDTVASGEKLASAVQPPVLAALSELEVGQKCERGGVEFERMA